MKSNQFENRSRTLFRKGYQMHTDFQTDVLIVVNRNGRKSAYYTPNNGWEKAIASIVSVNFRRFLYMTKEGRAASITRF